ncbi:MAG: hypothetical protein NTW03_07100 [Verrucomicrobia bacterium]|nr:hypothetical protein [Verrucomicrobiota bacterium]
MPGLPGGLHGPALLCACATLTTSRAATPGPAAVCTPAHAREDSGPSGCSHSPTCTQAPGPS